MFQNDYFKYIFPLVLGVILAVGVTALATSIGTTITSDGNISGGGNLSITGTSASSTVTLALGVGTSTPAVMFSVGGAAGNTTGHGYFTGGLGVGIATTTSGAFETTGIGLIGSDFHVTGDSILVGGLGVGVSTTTNGALETSGAGLIGGAFNVTGATKFNGTATIGANGTAVNSIIHGFCDFGPIIASQSIAASSTGAVACTSQAPTGLAAGDKIWLTASTTGASAIQNTGGASNIIVGVNYIYTGIASSTSSSMIKAIIYNLGNAAYTVTTSSWQYLIVK